MFSTLAPVRPSVQPLCLNGRGPQSVNPACVASCSWKRQRLGPAVLMCRNATYILKSAKPVAAEDIRAMLKVITPIAGFLVVHSASRQWSWDVLGDLAQGRIYGLPLWQWQAGAASLLSCMFRASCTRQAKKPAIAIHHGACQV